MNIIDIKFLIHQTSVVLSNVEQSIGGLPWKIQSRVSMATVVIYTNFTLQALTLICSSTG